MEYWEDECPCWIVLSSRYILQWSNSLNRILYFKGVEALPIEIGSNGWLHFLVLYWYSPGREKKLNPTQRRKT